MSLLELDAQKEPADGRYSRQRDIVPPARLATARATVVGVGAIGRQVALQLAAMGMPVIQIIDFDKVEDANLAAQGFLEIDVGKSKVNAVADLIRQINSETKVEAVDDTYCRGQAVNPVVFLCVDNMDTRRFIYEDIRDRIDIMIDGRMAAEVLRVITVDKKNMEKYEETLFTQAEAYQGSCTAKTTIYTSNIAAGVMISQYTKLLRNMPVDFDTLLNILALELITK